MKQSKTIPALRGRHAFTLTEVMISVALMVVLLFGINYIFSTSANAISAGQTSNDNTRNARAIQPVFFNDLNNAIKDPPAFIIASRRVSQWLNAADQQNNPTIGVTPAYTNAESHRIDTLSFFAHGFYHRRSADNNYYTSSTTLEDAWIQYGHAALPANDQSGWYGPEAADPSNKVTTYTGTNVSYPTATPQSVVGTYAADWVLARSAILLRDPGYIPNDAGGTKETYYSAPSTTAIYAANLAPLAFGSIDSANDTHVVGDSRYDMAGVTLEQFRRTVANAIINGRNSGGLWCAPLMYQVDATFNGTYYAWAGNPAMNRFQCNPLLPSPLTSQAVAQMSPYLIEHCSQFVVEYAGDYLTQDNTPTDASFGNITAVGGDGQIDYWKDANGNKHIRWYGLPRKTTLNGTSIRGYSAGDTTTNSNLYQDVIPLRDYYSLVQGSAVVGPVGPEVEVNFVPCADYASPTASTFTPVSRYACAWYNDVPSMVRILMKLDDPNNKVQDGPWYEFVFQLK